MALDLNKSLEFFDPKKVTKKVHIIGCGAVGSHVAELLARLGISNIILWDDDIVNTHNVANQNFVQADLGKYKVDVVAERIKAINPDCKVTTFTLRWEPSGMMSGYVFMCVDSVKPRQDMAGYAQYNDLTIFDIRMGLTSGQYYIVTKERLNDYVKTLQFTDEEADKNTPVSACGYTLSVAYSIWALVAYCISDVVRYWQGCGTSLTNLVDMDGGVYKL